MAGSPTPRYDPDLDVLRDPRAPDRYQCVYPTGRGRWRARVLKRLNLGTFPSAADAARAVLAFYRGRFGDAWRTAFRRRKANYWVVKKAAGGGFHANVYVEGRLTRVTIADTKRRPRPADRDADRWPDRQSARAAVARFVYFHYGMFWRLFLWRNPAPPPRVSAA